MTLSRNALSCLAAALLLFPLEALGADAAKQPENMMKMMEKHGELDDFVDLIEDADLEKFFGNAETEMTVFAPTDAALKKTPSAVMDKIKSDKATLQSFVKYHVINDSKVFSGNMRGRKFTPSTASGEAMTFDGTGDAIKINAAKFVATDIKASNGLLHVIDAPIIPASLEEKDAAKEADAKAGERVNKEKSGQESQPVQTETEKAAQQDEPDKTDAVVAPVERTESGAAPEEKKGPFNRLKKLFNW